jgi:hypothetical protein
MPEPIDYYVILQPMAEAGLTAAKAVTVRYKRLIDAGVPKLDALIQLRVLDVECKSVQAVAAWNGEGTLVLSGPVGASKSIAAAHWLDKPHDRRLWVDAKRLRSTEWSETRELFERATTVGALVIDDYGARGMTSKLAEELLIPILTARVGDLLPTVVTTNRSRAEFGDPRVVDRVLQMGRWVELRGESRRSTPPDIGKAQRYLDRAQSFVRLCDSLAGVQGTMADVEKLAERLRLDRAELEREAERVCEGRLRQAEELKAMFAGLVESKRVEAQ